MPSLSARSPWRRALAGGAVVLAASGLAGCGGGGTNSASSASDSSASTSASASDVKPGGTLSSDQVAQILKTATTSMKTAHVTMDMNGKAAGQTISMKADGDMQVSPLAERLTMSLMGQKIQALMVDKTMYMKSPLLGGGKKWAKTDMSKALGSSGLSDAMSNPIALIDKMAGAVTSATYKGEEKVNGAEAKHYTLVVDSKKLLDTMGAGGASAAPVAGNVNQDVWIDGDGRLVQSTTAMGSTGTVTMRMSDFNKKVSISAPPSAQVTALPVP